ncbi:MAG TPA: CBS domain-containing protein [Gemmataceae bacterium]
MKTLKSVGPAPAMFLEAQTAEDLMTPNPLSIRERATVREAAIFLAARGISAAPVIDEAGHPVGVVSRTDLLVRELQGTVYLVGPGKYSQRLTRPAAGEGGQVSEEARPAMVREVMTPVVFCVRPDTPVANVVEKMLALRVRRLFVVDRANVLVGVISTSDVLGSLRRPGPPIG